MRLATSTRCWDISGALLEENPAHPRSKSAAWPCGDPQFQEVTGLGADLALGLRVVNTPSRVAIWGADVGQLSDKHPRWWAALDKYATH
jgi:hypothetical protein